MNRRKFITGIAGILVASQAPAIVRAGSIMRIKPIIVTEPEWGLTVYPDPNIHKVGDQILVNGRLYVLRHKYGCFVPSEPTRENWLEVETVQGLAK